VPVVPVATQQQLMGDRRIGPQELQAGRREQGVSCSRLVVSQLLSSRGRARAQTTGEKGQGI
jgi:hypothetical protein